MMGYPLMDLFFLMLSGVLSGGTNLMVKQEPQVLEVAPGDKVNMTCNVTWAEGKQFRAEWKKDGKELHRSTPISRNSRQVTWGSRANLIWIPENTIILSLDDVNANDSGHYVCHVTMEIPVFKTAEGNGTQLIVSDSFKSSWNKLFPENHFYGNVLSYHQKAGPTTPVKGKSLACAPERKREESIYSTSFPKPPP
ncbi:transmembrane and immunoglobulin domain-containing protein 2 [Trichosurus vulpecula]|uniref:transmembrane and immunoglobulin domain-containing protein 2 n=1 Tax=Trichosurus vulpecula TaxID=9337 RepID=UPI00186B407A|nr:transmembrane and immunoglobulin domain-containing protein 2 [Trichosurus vulpecula]